MQKDQYPYLVEGQFNTRQDNYADAVLVDILYHIDQENLIPSLVQSAYYREKHQNIEDGLYAALQEEKQPNIYYFRYWHGSMAVLRPLFVFTGIQGARLILGGVLLLLILGVSFRMVKLKERGFAVCYLLANLVVQTWVCFFCIEYITTFLTANIGMLAALGLYRKPQQEKLEEQQSILFVVLGVVTCFVDFLTTETLTFTLPMLVIILLREQTKQMGSFRQEGKMLLQMGLIWGISYGGMFALKWGISAVILGKEEFVEALFSAGERLVGSISLEGIHAVQQGSDLTLKMGLGEQMMGALLYNLGCLFPFRERMEGGKVLVLCISVVLFCVFLIYLFRDKEFSPHLCSLFLLLSGVVYLHCLILSNHSYLHYFFTYRAQLTGVTALLYCTWRFGLKGGLRKKRGRQQTRKE